MQLVSIGIVGTAVVVAALFIAFAILASPLMAAALFVIAFGAFLVWRGFRRADADARDRPMARIPTTEQASADVVEDSGPAVVAGRRRA
jgi:hypothetical protein